MFMPFFDWRYFVFVALPIMALSFLASSWVKRTYPRYSQVRSSSGMIAVACLAMSADVVHSQQHSASVDHDATCRALRLHAENGVNMPEEQDGARRMLRAAGFAYWVALFGALLTLPYYASLVFGNRRS